MKTRARSDRSGMVRRGGFTLIELLIVITIIAALMALTASAVMKFIEVQQSNNTQSTLDRVQSQLSRAWSKVKHEAVNAQMTEMVPGTAMTASDWIRINLAQMGPNDPNALGRVRVIYVKLRMRQAFPMNFNEALNPFPLTPLPGYVSYLKSLGITASTGAPYESSACLLMALQRGASGAGINPSELTTGGAAGNVITPSGGSLPYLTDAWGRPIFFSRAPAGSFYLNPSFPAGWQNVANDPGDPQGYLQTPAWGTTYGPLFTQLTLQVLAPTNSSYKLAPMVASGGPVNWTKLGQTPPFNPITFAPVPGGGALFSTP